MKHDIEITRPVNRRTFRTSAGIVLTSLVCVAAVGLNSASAVQTASTPYWGPQWATGGQLKLPQGYHTWVFLGAPITPQGLNDGNAGFPEFHNVYIQHEAFQAYRKTGEFPEGTILLKELQLTRSGTHADGSRIEASGRGYFPGKANGIDISVKDSKRFKDTNGWGFFNFGHHPPPYAQTAAVQPKAACAACHEVNGTNMVFSKFYAPILDAK